MSDLFWEDPQAVAKFAGRDPDVRLLELLDGYDEPAGVRVLDLACAGGRNSVVLARRGFDVHAVDGSRAMVAHTRERLAPILGEDEARRRARHGRMDDLGHHADASFDLVVALGIYHCATSRAEWDAALAETARVLSPASAPLRGDPGGRLLVAIFTPESDLTGRGVRPVPGEPHLYDGLPSGRGILVDQQTLDAEMSRFGLLPDVPSRTVRVELDSGRRRVVVNALYRKAG